MLLLHRVSRSHAVPRRRPAARTRALLKHRISRRQARPGRRRSPARAVRFAVQNRADLFPGAPRRVQQRRSRRPRRSRARRRRHRHLAERRLGGDPRGRPSSPARHTPRGRDHGNLRDRPGVAGRRAAVSSTSTAIGGRHRVRDQPRRRPGPPARCRAVAGHDRAVRRVHPRRDRSRIFIGAEVVRRVAARSSVPMYGPGETYIGGWDRRRPRRELHHARRTGRRARRERTQWRPARSSRWRGEHVRVRLAAAPAVGARRDAAAAPGARYASGSRRSWDLYKWPVLGGVAVVALQGALIVGLLVNRRQRRRAQRALAERLRFETLVSELSAAFITVARARRARTDRESARAHRGRAAPGPRDPRRAR